MCRAGNTAANTAMSMTVDSEYTLTLPSTSGRGGGEHPFELKGLRIKEMEQWCTSQG